MGKRSFRPRSVKSKTYSSEHSLYPPPRVWGTLLPLVLLPVGPMEDRQNPSVPGTEGE